MSQYLVHNVSRLFATLLPSARSHWPYLQCPAALPICCCLASGLNRETSCDNLEGSILSTAVHASEIEVGKYEGKWPKIVVATCLGDLVIVVETASPSMGIKQTISILKIVLRQTDPTAS